MADIVTLTINPAVDISTSVGRIRPIHKLRCAAARRDLGRFAWRPFVLEADLRPGEYVIAFRATDAKGDVQPEDFTPNERG